ncbi:MAG: hypothetical protein DMF60_12605, partial [Acidobacteria bacterium]
AVEPILIRRYWSSEAAPAHRSAEARVLWSDKGLHILFNYPQQEPLVVSESPQTSGKAMRLWDRDVCEVFLAPGSKTPEKYFEFEGAPTGEWLDVGIRFTEQGREADWSFHSGMSVTAKVEGELILISMHIPWGSEIPKPSPSDIWRPIFFRCAGKGEGRGYVAWQPTLTEEPSFHVPELFGRLRFAP